MRIFNSKIGYMKTLAVLTVFLILIPVLSSTASAWDVGDEETVDEDDGYTTVGLDKGTYYLEVSAGGGEDGDNHGSVGEGEGGSGGEGGTSEGMIMADDDEKFVIRFYEGEEGDEVDGGDGGDGGYGIKVSYYSGELWTLYLRGGGGGGGGAGFWDDGGDGGDGGDDDDGGGSGGDGGETWYGDGEDGGDSNVMLHTGPFNDFERNFDGGTGPAEVTIEYIEEPQTITVAESYGFEEGAEGRVRFNGGSWHTVQEGFDDIVKEYHEGEDVKIEAEGTDGSRFKWWNHGPCNGQGSTCEFTMGGSDEKTWLAIELEEYDIDCSVGDGDGSVTGDCGSDVVKHGHDATVNAEPDSGYVFDEWSGHASGTDTQHTFYNVDEDKEAVANFLEEPNFEVSFRTGHSDHDPDGREEQDESSARVRVENTGEVEGTQEIVWNPGFGTASRDITVGPGGSSSTTLEVMPGVGDAGTYTGEVSSEDDSETTDVEIKLKEYKVSLNEDPSHGGSTSGEGTYERGDDVTIEAEPKDDWVFDTWSGDIGSDDKEYTFSIYQDITATANFLREAELVVDIIDTNSPVTEGDVLEVDVAVENLGDISDDDEVRLRDFDGNIVDTEDVSVSGRSTETETLVWDTDVGDGERTDNIEVELVKHGDTDTEEVTIEFIKYELDWTIEGGGRIRIDGEWHSDNSSEYFDRTTKLSPEASPDIGWVFDRWTGDYDGDPEEKEVEVYMDEDKEITAWFERDDFDLKINASGEGTESEYGLGTHEVEFEHEVELIANSSTGWKFVNWTGYIDSYDKEVGFEMPAENIVMTANFERREYDLTVHMEPDDWLGTVDGVVDVDGHEAEYGDTFTYKFEEEVNMEAYPGYGWVFEQWTGDEVSSDEREISFGMPHYDVEQTAHFKRDNFTLEVDVEGDGKLVIDGEQKQEGEKYVGEHKFEEVVDINAIPTGDEDFVGWVGDTRTIGDDEAADTEIEVYLEETSITAMFLRLCTYEIRILGPYGTWDEQTMKLVC